MPEEQEPGGNEGENSVADDRRAVETETFLLEIPQEEEPRDGDQGFVTQQGSGVCDGGDREGSRGFVRVGPLVKVEHDSGDGDPKADVGAAQPQHGGNTGGAECPHGGGDPCRPRRAERDAHDAVNAERCGEVGGKADPMPRQQVAFELGRRHEEQVLDGAVKAQGIPAEGLRPVLQRARVTELETIVGKRRRDHAGPDTDGDEREDENEGTPAERRVFEAHAGAGEGGGFHRWRLRVSRSG